MPGNVLTTQSQIICPHGGKAVLLTTQMHVQSGSLLLLESDLHVVTGCPYVQGVVPTPCLLITWSAGSTAVSVQGVPVLVRSSKGSCWGPLGMQGPATIAATQTQVAAR